MTGKDGEPNVGAKAEGGVPSAGWLQRWRLSRCATRGHRLRERTERGYRLPRDSRAFRAVAVVSRRHTRYCGRCGEILRQEIVDGHAVHSLTLDTPAMETLERDGEVWLTTE